jgi:hypothetical protein
MFNKPEGKPMEIDKEKYHEEYYYPNVNSEGFEQPISRRMDELAERLDKLADGMGLKPVISNKNQIMAPKNTYLVAGSCFDIIEIANAFLDIVEGKTKR